MGRWPTTGTPAVTIVVCTLNRPGQLRTCLQSLASQSNGNFEVLVVDNGPSEDVLGVALGCSLKSMAVRYVPEGHRGLTYARRRAWKCATGTYVAYLDDDAVASPLWVSSIIEGFSKAGPTAGMMGGPVNNAALGEGPWPFTDAPGESGLDLGKDFRNLNLEEDLWGGNSAFPRRVLVELDAFGERLGHRHGHPGANEDILIQRLIERAGLTRIYNPAMQIVHDSWRATATDRGLDRLAFYTGVDNEMMLRLLGHNSWSERVTVIKERLVRLRIQLAAGLRAYRRNDETAAREARRASMRSAGYIVGAAWPPLRLPSKRP